MGKSVIAREKILIIILSVFLCLFNSLVDSCLLQISSFWIYVVLVIIIMRGNFLHPYVWFLLMHTVYYTAYPILYYLNIRKQYGYSGEPLFLSALAALTFVVCVPGNININNIKKDRIYYNPYIRPVVQFVSIIELLSGIYIKISGFKGKNDIYSSSIILTSIFTIALLNIYLFSLDFEVNLNNDNKIDYRTTTLVTVSTLCLTLFSGERDLVLRLLVIIILFLFHNNRISKKQLMIVGLVFVVLIIPLSSQYKYYFSRDEVMERTYGFNLKTMLSNFLYGEFESASRNLQILVDNRETSYSIFYGKTLLSDITRILGYAPNSALHWFQSTFFTGRRTGMGFTIVGEGYVNFGYAGVILVYSIIGLMIRKLYSNYRKNVFWTYLYFCSIPIFIYANRADLSNIFSPFVRHLLLSLLIYFFIKPKNQKQEKC